MGSGDLSVDRSTVSLRLTQIVDERDYRKRKATKGGKGRLK